MARSKKGTSSVNPPDRADETPDPLTDEALNWLVRLHSGHETDADWTAYEDWKVSSPERARAAAQAETLWEKLGPALARKRTGRGKVIPALFLGAVVLGGALFAGGVFGPPQSYIAGQQTWVGERRTVTLGDGSVVDLDSGTSFDFDLRSDERRITLYTGQIFVSVQPNAQRPFVVRAGKGAVRALGTAFDVRHDGESTQVVVTEHAVRVSLPDAPAVDVQRGQQVAYSHAGKLGTPETADVQAATAWRRGQMIFEERPLGEVVAELSRYRRGKIAILDDTLRQLPVTGTFDTDDADALLDAVAAILPVTVRRFPLLTVIQRDAERSPQRGQN